MTTEEIQQALIDLGYAPGKVDGDYGPKTRAAVEAFQRATPGLKVDGQAGPLTQQALDRALDSLLGPAKPLLQLDRAKFYTALRSRKTTIFGTSLSQSQVSGIEGILNAFDDVGDGRDKTLGYGLATARREVGSGMVPVREGFCKTDAAARAYVKRHGYAYAKIINGHVYYGRGIVQLTWDFNYEAEGIANDPDKALEPVFAARLLFKGLLDGRWNKEKKGIAFYLPAAGADDLKNARRTVNITDHWQEVGENYRQFLAAISLARI